MCTSFKWLIPDQTVYVPFLKTHCLFWKLTSTAAVCYKNELTAQRKYTDFVHSNIKTQLCKYRGVFKRRMLAVIKKQRDANNVTLYRIVLLIVSLVMNIFLLSIDPWKSSITFFGINQNAPFRFFAFNFSKQFQLPKHHFNWRQNTPLFPLAFNIFSAFPTSKASFRKRLNALTSFLTSKCSKQFQNIFSNSVRMQHFVPGFQRFLGISNFHKHLSKCVRLHH